jgi:hypothetical protein
MREVYERIDAEGEDCTSPKEDGRLTSGMVYTHKSEIPDISLLKIDNLDES